jgi:tRNA U34 5-carboxymethylaminomethyl modifying enzyme MnmG/GidA
VSFERRLVQRESLITGQYDAHLTRQEADLKTFMEDESLLLDPRMDYSTVPGLSSEVVERLYHVEPTTIVCPGHSLHFSS